MITLRKIIYDIREILRGGNLVSDDDPISDRQIEYWISEARSLLIRQRIDKGQSVSDNITQTLNNIEVEQVEQSSNINLLSGCYIYRTKLPTPATIETQQTDLLLQVRSSLLGSDAYTLLPEGAAPYSMYNKFGKKFIKVYSNSGYLYLQNVPTLLETISMTGVFSDPKDAAEYSNDDGSPCFTYDSEYPISSDMLLPLKGMIMETHFKYIIKPLSDNTNNGAFNLEEQVKK